MQTLLTNTFPLMLLLFEWGLRVMLKVDASGFMGPTLAAAALSFLLPLTKPVHRRIGVIDNRQVVVKSNFDENFVAFTWLLVFLCLFAWAAACYFSLIEPQDRVLFLSTHLAIGGGAYVTSLLMTSLKEEI